MANAVFGNFVSQSSVPVRCFINVRHDCSLPNFNLYLWDSQVRAKDDRTERLVLIVFFCLVFVYLLLLGIAIYLTRFRYFWFYFLYVLLVGGFIFADIGLVVPHHVGNFRGLVDKPAEGNAVVVTEGSGQPFHITAVVVGEDDFDFVRHGRRFLPEPKGGNGWKVSGLAHVGFK
ncbi:MAG: hypothetical protein HY842_10890 [Bacteroidetes bacterium]|nr:hypothetical protein [Bacteroidota bacterium]